MLKITENEWGTFIKAGEGPIVHIPSEKLQSAINKDEELRQKPNFEKIIWEVNNSEEAHFN